MTILCYGEIDLDICVKLDRLPTMERSASCSEDFENIGGAAANSAMWLANWGLPTRLAGHDLGDDRPGDVVRELLAELCPCSIPATSPATPVIVRRAANAWSHPMASAASSRTGPKRSA